jgi:hypothetical protein
MANMKVPGKKAKSMDAVPDLDLAFWPESLYHLYSISQQVHATIPRRDSGGEYPVFC